MKGYMVLAVAALLAMPAAAELLAYEGFNYTGNLVGQDGGTGFSGAWQGTGDVAIDPTSYGYPAGGGLLASGGKLLEPVGSGGIKAYRMLPESCWIDLYNKGDEPGGFQAKTVYLSFLMSKTNGGSSNDYLAVGFIRTGTPGGAATIDVSTFTASSGFSSDDRAGNYSYGNISGIPGWTISDAPLMVVIKATTTSTGAGNTVLSTSYKFYKPGDTIGAEPTVGTDWSHLAADKTISSTAASFQLDRIAIVSTNVNESGVDEIRLGTTWADVTGYQSVVIPPKSALSASTPAALDLGRNLAPNTAKTLTSAVTLTNTGEDQSTLNVTGYTIDGTDAAKFAIGGLANPVDLAKDASASFDVTLLATTPGNYSATVTFTTDAAQGATDAVYTLSAKVLQPGDANDDFKVEFSDYLVLESHFGMTGGATLADADFNGDGNVAFEDYLILEANFGAAPAAVPEPMTLSLLVLGGLALMRRR